MRSRDKIFYYGMISLWEYWALLTWEVDKGIFDDLRLSFRCFQAMKGPLGSQMVLNGLTSVPWEVEINFFTMGWFHYGNIERYSLERWTKEYLMIWGIFFMFSGYEGPPKGPRGSLMVLNGQTSVPWEVTIKYFTIGWFHCGNTERYSLKRWIKGYLMIEGILFAVFRHWGAP